jgi:hypothetical protein
MVQHILHGFHQVLWNGDVELLAGILEWPLVVVHHPLGAHKPQPEEEPQQFNQSSG